MCIRDRHAEIDTATTLMESLVARWGPDAPDTSEPKALALGLQGTIPVVHGAGPTAAVARRWKTQINENAKAAAFWSELPEADHNEICGWERGRQAAPLSGVFLEDDDQHPRVKRRIDLTEAVVQRAGAAALRAAAEGDSRLERVLSLVLLGDLVSLYLAALDAVDPGPVEALTSFKAALS